MYCNPYIVNVVVDCSTIQMYCGALLFGRDVKLFSTVPDQVFSEFHLVSNHF